MTTPSYEFDATQNELIQDLSGKMQFVGYFMVGIGIVSGIVGLLNLLSPNGISSIIQGAIDTLIGVWTLKASRGFRSIVETAGQDMENLLGALGGLRQLYWMQYWGLVIALGFMVITLLLGILASLTGWGNFSITVD